MVGHLVFVLVRALYELFSDGDFRGIVITRRDEFESYQGGHPEAVRLFSIAVERDLGHC